MQALMAYDWGGSVRELENAVERAVVFTNTGAVPLSVLPQFLPKFAEAPHLKFKIGVPLQELESQAIKITLAHTPGDKAVAARLLGVFAADHLSAFERKKD
jgi:two-component system NtrC family response regulator